LDDRETEPKAAAAFARCVLHLVKFIEDSFDVFLCNSDTCIPYFDTQRSGPSPASDKNFTRRGIFERVSEQIAGQLFEQYRTAAYSYRRRNDTQ
jgi:hypothetical protein